MKKLFFVSLMAMLAGSAWAEWVMHSKNEEVTFYHDPATIRKDGNMRRVWELLDFRKRAAKGDMSTRMRREYDCKQERYRYLAISTHTEPMAGGTILFSSGESNSYRSIAPGTFDETIFNIVCSK